MTKPCDHTSKINVLHSNSIVPGGLGVTSNTTRATVLHSFTMRDAANCNNSVLKLYTLACTVGLELVFANSSSFSPLCGS